MRSEKVEKLHLSPTCRGWQVGLFSGNQIVSGDQTEAAASARCRSRVWSRATSM
jgi:hypothetical protein